MLSARQHMYQPFAEVTAFSGVAGAFGGKIFFTGGSSQTTTWMGTPG